MKGGRRVRPPFAWRRKQVDLKTRLLEDMQRAMKQREAGRLRLGVIRLARAAIKNAEIAKGRSLDDSDVLEILAREVKMRRESMAEYERLGRPDAASKLEEEISVLFEYLPKQMEPAEIREAIQQVISEVGAKGPGDLGRVMGRLMPLVRGKADGKLVREMAESILREIGG